jgi:uncharacterized membrane protein
VSVVINQPVDEVFAFVSDARNNPLWQEGIMEVEPLSAQTTGVGARGRFKRRMFGREIAGTAETTEYEPSRTFAYRGTAGPIAFGLHYTFESLGHRTKLNLVFEYRLQGALGLAGPWLARRFRAQYQSYLGNLKRLLESGEC